MIHRLINEQLKGLLSVYPAAVLVGPRQCGKTTLARSLGGAYFDLEQESDRLKLDLDWSRVVQSDRLTVLDEAQTVPDLFPRLRGAIDADRKRAGRFLLLGSVSPALMTQVAESLAGRMAVVELTPFLLQEVSAEALDRLWLTGGFPDGGILETSRFPRWQRDYMTLLVQRDLPTWGLPARPQMTERLIRMLAAVHGGSWNASQLAQSLGIDYKTVNAYVDFLAGAFLVRRLPAYFANLTKRLVKAPKVYLRDTGLLHAMLNIADRESLLAQPWVGASWEGFVIEQIISHLNSLGRSIDAFHFRTSDGWEIDLVLQSGTERIAIEIKLTSSPSSTDVARLHRAADLIGASRRYLISRTPTVTRSDQTVSCDLATALAELT